MKIVCIFLLIISIQAVGQIKIFSHSFSPDKNFSLTVVTKDLGGDSNSEWTYWLRDSEGDSSLLTTTILHDLPAPVAVWNKSSTRLIFDEQAESEIRIYDLGKRKVIFQTKGSIGGHSMEHFDQDRGVVVFTRQIARHPGDTYELLTLDTNVLSISPICQIKTSGDPITGTPRVKSMDRAHRRLIVTFEDSDFTTQELRVDY